MDTDAPTRRLHPDPDPTTAPAPAPASRALTFALPTFRAPTPSTLDPPASSTSTATPTTPAGPPVGAEGGAAGPGWTTPAPAPGPGPSRRTRTSTDGAGGGDLPPALRPGGDPAEVARTVAGALLIALAALSLVARRGGRELRPPTPEQRDAIAAPVARILCRHLPMDLLGPDFADATECAVAVQDYTTDGPLIRPAGTAAALAGELDELGPVDE